MKLAIVVGEASGDRLAAGLIDALRSDTAELEVVGLGRQETYARGLRDIVDFSIEAAAGIAPLFSWRMWMRRIDTLARAIVAARPQGLVIVDAPDFTHRVARKVRSLAPDIPIINYPPPTVWAWRSGRAAKMREWVDLALVFFPFEAEAMRALGGPPCQVVGHPAMALPWGAGAGSRWRAAHGIGEGDALVAVAVGSRAREVRDLAAPFGETLARLAALRSGRVASVALLARETAEQARQALAAWSRPPDFMVEGEARFAAMEAADAAISATGTALIEFALADTPTLGAWQVTWGERMIFTLGRATGLVRARKLSLLNAMLEDAPQPEEVGARKPNPARMAAILAEFLQDPRQGLAWTRRAQAAMYAGFAGEDTRDPSTRAAAWVAQTLRAERGGDAEHGDSA